MNGETKYGKGVKSEEFREGVDEIEKIYAVTEGATVVVKHRGTWVMGQCVSVFEGQWLDQKNNTVAIVRLDEGGQVVVNLDTEPEKIRKIVC